MNAAEARNAYGRPELRLDDAVLDVGDTGRLDRPYLLDFEVADLLQKPLASTEQDRGDVELELVDQPGGEVLLRDVGTSPEQYVLAVGGLSRLLECGLDSVSDEDEGCAPLHLQGLTRMVGQYEDRRVKGRIVAPPAIPKGVLAPRAGSAPEHVAAHEGRADVRLQLLDTGVLALTTPPSWPCCLRHASSSKTHSCRAIPPTPSGCSSLWSGPATYPSRETASWNLSVLIQPPRLRWLWECHVRYSISLAGSLWAAAFSPTAPGPSHPCVAPDTP
jgi:hypothetical protein